MPQTPLPSDMITVPVFAYAYFYIVHHILYIMHAFYFVHIINIFLMSLNFKDFMHNSGFI